MKRLILLLWLIPLELFSQPNELEDILEKVKSNTVKNIYSYNIVKMYNNRNFIDSNGFFVDSYQYDELYGILETPKYDLELQQNNVELKYPDSNYSLIAFSLPKIHYQYVCDTSYRMLVGISDQQIRFSRDYLVAYPKNYGRNVLPLIFISGSFVKTSVWKDFKNKGLEPDNIINFLKLKCYSLNIEEIVYLKKDNKWIWCNVKLKNKIEKRIIKMSVDNPDIVMLLLGQQIEWRNDGTFGQGILGG